MNRSQRVFGAIPEGIPGPYGPLVTEEPGVSSLPNEQIVELGA